MRKLRLLLLAYGNKFTLIIVAYVILHFILTTLVATHGQAKYLDVEYLKVTHYNFATALFSAIPVSLIVSNSLEFTKGIASKIICSGVTRSEYYWSKMLQSVIVSCATTSLYIILNVALFLFFQFDFSESAIFFKGIWICFTISLLVNLFVANLSFLIYDWKIGAVTYIAYCFLESILVFVAGENLPAVKWLPVQTLSSFFLFENRVLLSFETISKFLTVIVVLGALHLTAIRRFDKKAL
jgi:hypothetical protein